MTTAPKRVKMFFATILGHYLFGLCGIALGTYQCHAKGGVLVGGHGHSMCIPKDKHLRFGDD
jgi:hypothetical protein